MSSKLFRSLMTLIGLGYLICILGYIELIVQLFMLE